MNIFCCWLHAVASFGWWHQYLLHKHHAGLMSPMVAYPWPIMKILSMRDGHLLTKLLKVCQTSHSIMLTYFVKSEDLDHIVATFHLPSSQLYTCHLIFVTDPKFNNGQCIGFNRFYLTSSIWKKWSVNSHIYLKQLCTYQFIWSSLSYSQPYVRYHSILVPILPMPC